MHASIRIREASGEDAAALADLCGELGYPADTNAMRRRLDHLLQRSELAILVACHPDAGVVGTVHVVESPGLTGDFKVRVPSLVVATAFRGHGIGTGLMHAAAAWGRLRGAHTVELSSQAHRTDAHRFYERLGYQRIKTSAVFKLGL